MHKSPNDEALVVVEPTKLQTFLCRKWVALIAALPGTLFSVLALSKISVVLAAVAIIPIDALLMVFYAHTVVRFSNTVMTAISLYVLFVVSQVLVFLSIAALA